MRFQRVYILISLICSLHSAMASAAAPRSNSLEYRSMVIGTVLIVDRCQNERTELCHRLQEADKSKSSTIKSGGKKCLKKDIYDDFVDYSEVCRQLRTAAKLEGDKFLERGGSRYKKHSRHHSTPFRFDPNSQQEPVPEVFDEITPEKESS